MATTTEHAPTSLSDTAYALIGMGEATLTRLRQRADRGDAVPDQLLDRVRDRLEELRRVIDELNDRAQANLREHSGQVRGTYEDLATRGRRVMERIAAQPEVQQAEHDLELAKRSVTGATTGVERSADRATQKVKAAMTSARTAVRSVADAAGTALDEVGGGSYDREALHARTKDELYDLATREDIAGRSTMSKDELVDALAAT